MHFRTLIALSLSFLVVGCATTQKVPAKDLPSIEATNFSTVSQTLSSYTVDVTAAVQNPSPLTFQVTKVTYTLTADDKPVREGEAPLNVGVPPTASGQFDVQVAVEYAPTLADFEDGQESIRVVFKGIVEGHYGEAKVELPLERAGLVRSPRLPTVSLGAPEASRQRIDAVAANFFIDVQNENPFEVKVRRLDYVLEVEGHEISAGTLASRSTLPPSASNRYEVDTELTEETLPGLTKLMKDKNALDYSVRGTLWVGDLQIPVDLKSQIKFAAER